MSNDPLAESSAPSISFKDAQVGTSYTGRVVGTPELVQSRDFKTREPATWPDGNPKMSLVVKLDINGEVQSLWAPKPSAMWAALAAARQAAGVPLDDGCVLTVTFSGTKPKPGMDPQKLYSATYSPAKSDPLGAGTSPNAATQEAQQAPPF